MYAHRLILLLVLAIFMFSPVIIDWWLSPAGAWYRPFAIWLVLVVAAIGLQRWQEHDEL